MKFFKIVKPILVISMALASAFTVAGSGSDSPNPTGGFGSESTSGQLGNPTGGFGDFTTLSEEEPPTNPPPPSIPLDAGASILIVSGLALGGRKLLKSLKALND